MGGEGAAQPRGGLAERRRNTGTPPPRTCDRRRDERVKIPLLSCAFGFLSSFQSPVSCLLVWRWRVPRFSMSLRMQFADLIHTPGAPRLPLGVQWLTGLVGLPTALGIESLLETYSVFAEISRSSARVTTFAGPAGCGLVGKSEEVVACPQTVLKDAWLDRCLLSF